MKWMLFILAFTGVTQVCGQTVVFNRTYSNYGYEHGRGVVQCSDTGYAIVGATSSWGPGNSDVYLVRTDSLGVYLWSATYGGPDLEWGYDIVETSDSGLRNCRSNE